MKLLPLDSSEMIEVVAGWISDKENYQWLEFGDGGGGVSPAWLKIMVQRKTEAIRVFTPDYGDNPIGVIALTNIRRNFKTADIWAAVGDKSFRARGYTTAATCAMLTFGFEELGLHAITAVIVDGNPSIRIVERLGFHFIGRQRQCHYIDGQPRDRLLFDLLASEHKLNASASGFRARTRASLRPA